MSDIQRYAYHTIKDHGLIYDPHGAFVTFTDHAAALTARDAELAEVKAERDKALSFIMDQGYRRCDIAACNCGSWHGGHASQRLREISDTLTEAGCEPLRKTALVAVCELAQERDDLRFQIADHAAALLTDTDEDSKAKFLEAKANPKAALDQVTAEVSSLRTKYGAADDERGRLMRLVAADECKIADLTAEVGRLRERVAAERERNRPGSPRSQKSESERHMRNAKETGERGPIYGVALIDSLPLDGGMQQAMPCRQDLERVRRSSERTVAGYEVLLEHYRRVAERLSAYESRDAANLERGKCGPVSGELSDRVGESMEPKQ